MKLRQKIIIICAAVTAVFIFITAAFNRPLFFWALTNQTQKKLSQAAGEIELLVPDDENYYYEIFSLCNKAGVNAEIASADGFLVYTTEGNSPSGQNSFTYFGSSVSVFFDAKQNNSYSVKKTDSFCVLTAGADDYFVYHFHTDMGNTVYVYTPVTDTTRMVSLAAKVYSVFFVIFPLVMAAIILIVIFSFTKPVEDMKRITKKMASLDFEEKCKTGRRDEIGTLGENINALSKSLSAALSELKVKNEALERDIEQKNKLEEERKLLISNVSHELKTPIAVISGYAGALLDSITDDPQVMNEYCSIIADESEKMRSMVTSLLEMSRLESKTEQLNITEFDMQAQAFALIKALRFECEKRDIEIECLIETDCIVKGDEEKIRMALKNYITNAIYHCDTVNGEKKITVMKRDNEFIVFNTGSKIAQDDIEHLWQGFYRADKSRQRDENRYGLGLAIVKNIIEMHGGEYGVRNKENGVEFFFTL